MRPNRAFGGVARLFAKLRRLTQLDLTVVDAQDPDDEDPDEPDPADYRHDPDRGADAIADQIRTELVEASTAASMTVAVAVAASTAAAAAATIELAPRSTKVGQCDASAEASLDPLDDPADSRSASLAPESPRSSIPSSASRLLPRPQSQSHPPVRSARRCSFRVWRFPALLKLCLNLTGEARSKMRPYMLAPRLTECRLAGVAARDLIAIVEHAGGSLRHLECDFFTPANHSNAQQEAEVALLQETLLLSSAAAAPRRAATPVGLLRYLAAAPDVSTDAAASARMAATPAWLLRPLGCFARRAALLARLPSPFARRRPASKRAGKAALWEKQPHGRSSPPGAAAQREQQQPFGERRHLRRSSRRWCCVTRCRRTWNTIARNYRVRFCAPWPDAGRR
jgi:hypothetical protein